MFVISGTKEIFWMGWKITKIWCDHLVKTGTHKGTKCKAYLKFSDIRGGYDVYPPSCNQLKDAELARNLEDVYAYIGKGWGVRCEAPDIDFESILHTNFKATFEQN